MIEVPCTITVVLPVRPVSWPARKSETLAGCGARHGCRGGAAGGEGRRGGEDARRAGEQGLESHVGPPEGVECRCPAQRRSVRQVTRAAAHFEPTGPGLERQGTMGAMTELPRKAAARTARLAALPLGYAGRQAMGFGKRLGGKPADAVLSEVQQRTAEQLFRTLGELKGGAMKFGQALSVLESALPEELAAPYREHLTALQDSAPPMPTATVRQQLTTHLGADWRERLVWLDGAPTAAASIGQVHRGRWLDHAGRRRRARRRGQGAVPRRRRGADVRPAPDRPRRPRASRRSSPASTSSRSSPSCRRAPPTSSTTTWRRRPRRRTPRRSPTTPTSWCPPWSPWASEVLVTEWMDSPHSLAHVIREGTQEERDHYGELFVRFLFEGPRLTGMLHADPHPGNFRILPAPGRRPRPHGRPRLRRGRPPRGRHHAARRRAA